MKKTVQGRLITGSLEAENPGDFYFLSQGGSGVTIEATGLPAPLIENAGLGFVCPCGCGTPGCVMIAPNGEKSHNWTWDGNTEKPTLTPSIQRVGGCKWHGYLRNGVWESC